MRGSSRVDLPEACQNSRSRLPQVRSERCRDCSFVLGRFVRTAVTQRNPPDVCSSPKADVYLSQSSRVFLGSFENPSQARETTLTQVTGALSSELGVRRSEGDEVLCCPREFDLFATRPSLRNLSAFVRVWESLHRRHTLLGLRVRFGKPCRLQGSPRL